MSDAFRRCDATGLCKFLLERLVSGSGRGFYTLHTVKLDAPAGSEPTFQGVAYRTDAKDRGLLLNFCPFCGGRPGKSAQPKSSGEAPPPNIH